ncbi:uncharacterized protein LOC107489135 [Arachis duranensis]|uniref:Uncharacterized protein LOC107489135 n=1 Tax=Arachis duranensis TaxID=130453 RepID=A0A9C6WUC5_ARADU|nr:uncharacterized protein LOC107489135 [Arachis duranensis]
MGDRETGRSYVVSMAAERIGLEDLMAQFLPKASKDSSATHSVEHSTSPSAEVHSALPPPKSAGPIVTAGSSSSGVVPLEAEPAGRGSDVAIIDNPRKWKSAFSPEGSLTVMEKNFDIGGFIDSTRVWYRRVLS